ncbi:MAG: trehalose-6-phosphate synthase [Thermoleophilia bacterium]
MARRRLIVVSNRGPASFARAEDGSRVPRRGGGGLVTALRGLLRLHDVTWIASAMTAEDRVVAAETADEPRLERARDGSPYRLRLVAHDPAAYDAFYNVIANPLLWFVQHQLWPHGSAPDFDDRTLAAWQDGYVAVNRNLADAVLAELARDPAAAVLFHDYHLYLAPGLVRAAAPSARIAHFVHVPWPQPDAWRVLPQPLRRAIYEGILASDVVGVHTARWRANLLRGCRETLGADVDEEQGVVRHAGRPTVVRARPISVDPEEFEGLRADPAVQARVDAIRARRPEHLILRVDRTDPSKNVVRGFRAYALLLERHPELRGRVQLLALLDPSRQEIPEYTAYLTAVRREAEAVNARFGGNGWLPLDLRVRDDFAESLAGYVEYDALLVNAVYDGMNLVAKEAPLLNERAGVLVLSENAGAHEELGRHALTVNPFDVGQQAEALHAALTMPAAERQRRLDALRAHVREHDVARWIEGQLHDLDAVGGP